MKIVWSKSAVRHLSALRDDIAEESRQNAAAVAEQILTCVDLLVAQPDLGREARVDGARELVIPGLPYTIAYRVKGGQLHLIAVFHATRDRFERL